MSGTPYREPGVAPPDPYLRAWRRLRALRWCAALSFPVYALVITATGLLLHRVPTAVFWVVFAFIPISNVCLGLFTCPKCREEYGGKAWPACILRCWVSTCSRCGVREGTAGGDAPKL